MKKTLIMLLALLAFAMFPLAALGDGPHFFIVLSEDEDSYGTALFIREYLATFGVKSEIRESMSDITREETISCGHPLSIRFWWIEDKVVLRSEDLRTGTPYFIMSEYGRTTDPVGNRAWLTEVLNDLAYDLYLDGLIEKDSRMKAEYGAEEEELPMIWLERGYGESERYAGCMLEALLEAGLPAAMTDNSLEEEIKEGEHPFSMRLWMLPEFVELSLFDISDKCRDDQCYYLDTVDRLDDEDMTEYFRASALQIRRLMENDRHLTFMVP